MKLYDNWKLIVKKAWSIRFIAAAGFFTASEQVVPLFVESIPQKVYAALIMICVMLAFISRIVAQQDV